MRCCSGSAIPALPQSAVLSAPVLSKNRFVGPLALWSPARTPQSSADCCDVTQRGQRLIQGPAWSQMPTQYPPGPCAVSTNRLGACVNVFWVLAGTHPRSGQHRPFKMPLTRFGGALGTQRGPKCSQARAPLQNAAAALPGLPSHTRRPKSLLRDTCVSGASAKRIHLVKQSAAATGLG